MVPTFSRQHALPIAKYAAFASLIPKCTRIRTMLAGAIAVPSRTTKHTGALPLTTLHPSRLAQIQAFLVCEMPWRVPQVTFLDFPLDYRSPRLDLSAEAAATAGAHRLLLLLL